MNNKALEIAVINGKSKDVIRLIKADISDGSDPTALINCMIDALKIVGDKFQTGEIQISDMLTAAMAMKKGVTYLTPLIKTEGKKAEKVIVGMAAGDLHDIGKNLVTLMLDSFGFRVIDLGIDVSCSSFADAILENPDCKVMTISATLESTIPEIKNTINYLIKNNLRDGVKIIVGGSPLNERIAEELGADAYASTATLTAIKVKEFIDSYQT